MTIRLYLDEDSMRRSLVRALRARGIDVVTALDAGMIQQEDREHLAYASEHGRVLCTFNVAGFYRLHRDYLTQGKRHAGIILMQQQRSSVGEQLRRLLRLIASKSAEEMEDWVEFLSAWGER
jgi:predicted nuclease of predicted toxin-antitoxin system